MCITVGEYDVRMQFARRIIQTEIHEEHTDPEWPFPPWAAWHRRAARKAKEIQSITRYATVAIAIIQGVGYFFLMKNYGILTSTSVWAALVIIVSFIAGSSFVMWMGEQITEFGIGNGISIILFAGILSRVSHHGVPRWSGVCGPVP